MRLSFVLGLVLGAGFVAGACVGDDPATSDPTGSSSGDASTPSGSSGTTSSSSGAATSSGAPSSSSSSSSGSACAGRCEANDLVSCEGVHTACVAGCTETGGAHCKVFEPSGPVTAQDLRQTGLAPVAITGGGTLDLDTGEILNPEGNVVRRANEGSDLQNGVRFWRTTDAVIFEAQRITFDGTSEYLTWAGDTTLPVIFVATEEISVHGSVLFPCGQLGGAPTTAAGADGAGDTGGKRAPSPGGASGATHGGRGGLGGAGYTTTFQNGANVDPTNQDFAFRGGSAGGGGTTSDPSKYFGRGGSGGSAIQLIAGVAIHLGDGTDHAGNWPQGLSVGGCEGGAGNADSTSAPHLGGGGGAGGFLLLEAPTIDGAAYAGLAANGGGGGGGDPAFEAQWGGLSSGVALGAQAGTCGMAGGNGAAGAQVDGAVGASAQSNAAGCTATGGGGGGGAVGRIVVNTLTLDGIAASTSGTAPFFVSPSTYRKGTLTFEP